MIKPEQKAISMFNSALKVCLSLSAEMKKNEAKIIVLNQIKMIKESLYDACMIDDVPPLKKTIAYYQNVESIINEL